MNAAVTFRHMEPSDTLRQHVQDKLAHLASKFSRVSIDASAVLTVERYWHIAALSLVINGQPLQSNERDENMYTALDRALDKLERQLRRRKDKLRDHKPAQSTLAPPASTSPEDRLPMHPSLSEDDLDLLNANPPTLPGPEEFGHPPA